MDARLLCDRLRDSLAPMGFTEVHKDLRGVVEILAVIKKPFNLLNGLFGGRGLVALAQVPASLKDAEGLAGFASEVRRAINGMFLAFPYYKSMHSFIVLLCGHPLFEECAGVESRLKDRTGLHRNLVQGVVVVDAETGQFRSDYTRPAQHKREFEAVVEAVERARVG